MRYGNTLGVLLALFPLYLAGCAREGKDVPSNAAHHHENTGQTTSTDAKIKAERAKLDPEDQRLVEAQDFCVVMEDHRLGSMGPPIKVMIKDQPVFLCCKGCRKRALSDPDKTLAKVADLKAKKKSAPTGS